MNTIKMEIIYSLQEENVHCGVCMDVIRRGKCCVLYDGQYYHGPCMFRGNICDCAVDKICNLNSISFKGEVMGNAHPNMVRGLQVSAARQKLIARYDTVINIRVQTITAETIAMVDRIRYLIPLKTEGDTVTINVYESYMQKWDAERHRAVMEIRSRLAKTNGTWANDIAHDAQSLDKTELHEVAVVEKEAEREEKAEGSKNDLVGDENLQRDAEAILKQDDALLDGSAVNVPEPPLSVVDPKVLDIDPSLNNPNYDAQVKRALTSVKRKEFLDAKKLQYLRNVVSKQALSLKNKASTSVVPYFNEKSSGLLAKLYNKISNLPSFAATKLPGFDTFKNWISKNVLDRISVDMVRDKIFKVAMEKINMTEHGKVLVPTKGGNKDGVMTLLSNFFAKFWHVIQPAVDYVLGLGKDATKLIKLDGVKGALSTVTGVVKGITGGTSNSNVLSNLNLNNLSSTFSSIVRWIVPAFKQLLKLVMQLKNIVAIISALSKVVA